MLKQLAQVMMEIDQQAGGIERETQTQNGHFSAVLESIGAMQVDFNKSVESLDTNLDFGGDLNKLSDKPQGMVGKFKVTDNNWSTMERSEKRPPEKN